MTDVELEHSDQDTISAPESDGAAYDKTLAEVAAEYPMYQIFAENVGENIRQRLRNIFGEQAFDEHALELQRDILNPVIYLLSDIGSAVNVINRGISPTVAAGRTLPPELGMLYQWQITQLSMLTCGLSPDEIAENNGIILDPDKGWNTLISNLPQPVKEGIKLEVALEKSVERDVIYGFFTYQGHNGEAIVSDLISFFSTVRQAYLIPSLIAGWRLQVDEEEHDANDSEAESEAE